MPDQLTRSRRSGPWVSLKGPGLLSVLLRGMVKANLIHHLAHTGGTKTLRRIGRAYVPPRDWHAEEEPAEAPADARIPRGLRRLSAVPTPALKESDPGFKDLRAAVKKDPRAVWAWVGLGLNYLRLWDGDDYFHKSFECFDEAVRLRPEWAWGYLLRGEALRSLLDYAGALKDYGKAIELDPEFAWAYAFKARVLFQQGTKPEDNVWMDKAISLEPGAGWMYAWRAEGLRRLGRLEEAEKDFRKALRLDPLYDQAYGWRARLLGSQGRYKEALASLKKGIALCPFFEKAYRQQVRVLRLAGRTGEALKTLKKAADLNHRNDWLGNWRIEGAPQDPASLQAFTELDIYVRGRPRDAWALAWRGETLGQLGRFEAAVADLDRALRLDPALAWAYAWRGECLIRLGRTAAAKRDLDRAVRLDKTYGRAWAWRGRLKADAGDWKGAVLDYDRAMEARRVEYSWIYGWRGQAKLRLGRREEALKDLEAAVNLDANCPQFGDWLEEAREGQGKPTGELKSLEFFVNYACNAKCPFCFNPPDASPELERGLPFEELARRMYAGYQQGYRAIKFIGGEVTIREDLPKILGLARRIGYLSIQITTNGIRLADPLYARKLVSLGADRFRFSIHGHTPELHDRLVAVPGAFEKIRKAVASLKPMGVKLGVNYVLNRLNYQAFPETLAFFYGELGIPDVIVYFLRYQGFGALPENKELLKLRMSETAPFVREAFRRLGERGYEGRPALIHFPPCVMPELEEHMLDWTRDPAGSGQGNTPDDRTVLPDGTGDFIHEMTNSGKRQVPACALCLHSQRCLGVEANYVEIFGDSEFKAIQVAEAASA